MSPESAPDANRSTERERPRSFRRRGFLAAGAALSTTLIAGCTSDIGSNPTDGGGPSGDGSDGTSGIAGTFRLLISDQPVAIDEFDALNVSFDRARVFRGEWSDGEVTDTVTSPSPTETVTDTQSPSATKSVTETASPNSTETEDDSEGFVVIELGGATVDLTQVVGEKAIGVFEGELQAGRYTKIELYAADVEGIVDGESVDVKIPSGKLQIVKPFEVVAGETLSFVFDINVVKKGPNGYNLLPVISKSGVAGEDVEVTEVGDGDDEEGEPAETEAEDGEGEGPPDDPGGQP